MKKCQYRVIEECGTYKVQKRLYTPELPIESICYTNKWVICYDKYREAEFTDVDLAIAFCKTTPTTVSSDNVVFEIEL